MFGRVVNRKTPPETFARELTKVPLQGLLGVSAEIVEDKAAARRARLCGALVLATGLVVLALNLFGM